MLNGGTLAATQPPNFLANFIINGQITAGGDVTSTISAMIANAVNSGGLSFDVNTVASSLLVSGVINANGAAGITKTGPGTLTLSNQNIYAGGTIVSGGTLVLDSTAFNNPATILTRDSDLTITGIGSTVSIQGTHYNAIFNSGGGTVTINAGGLLSDDGTVNNANNLFNLVLNGGTLAATQAPAGDTSHFNINNQITAGGGVQSTISAVIKPTTTGNLTVDVSDDSSLNVSGAIVANGTNGITKIGTGTLIFANASNTYNGPTTVSEGTLLVNGGLSSLNAAVTVQSGATLGGSGTISRSVSVAGGAILDPGSPGTPALFTVGDLTLADASVLRFDIPLSGAYDSITVVGDFTFTGAATASLLVPADLNVAGETTYHLINCTDLENPSATVSASYFSLAPIGGGSFPSGYTYLLQASGDSKQLNLIVSPITVGPATWDGIGGGNWSGDHWSSATPPSGEGVQAVLGGAIESDSDVTIDQAVVLGRLDLDSSHKYTLSASGSSTDTLTMQANGSAAINVLGGDHAITAPLVLASPTTVTLTNSADDLAISGLINGAGSLTKDGPGSLTLSNSGNDYGGTTVINGTLVIASAGALPAGKSLSIGSGGTLILGGGMAIGAAASAEPVPEPGTLALLAIAGLTGVMIWRRRR